MYGTKCQVFVIIQGGFIYLSAFDLGHWLCIIEYDVV